MACPERTCFEPVLREVMTVTNYWQTETPVVAASAKNVLRWFPKAGRLQVSLPDWDGKH